MLLTELMIKWKVRFIINALSSQDFIELFLYMFRQYSQLGSNKGSQKHGFNMSNRKLS